MVFDTESIFAVGLDVLRNLNKVEIFSQSSVCVKCVKVPGVTSVQLINPAFRARSVPARDH